MIKTVVASSLLLAAHAASAGSVYIMTGKLLVDTKSEDGKTQLFFAAENQEKTCAVMFIEDKALIMCGPAELVSSSIEAITPK